MNNAFQPFRKTLRSAWLARSHHNPRTAAGRAIAYGMLIDWQQMSGKDQRRYEDLVESGT